MNDTVNPAETSAQPVAGEPAATTGTEAAPAANPVASSPAPVAGALDLGVGAATSSGVTDEVINEPAVTAAELLGMNPGDFATTTFEKFAPGRYMFRINAMGLDTKPTKNGPTNVVEYELEVVQVVSVSKVPDGKDPEKFAASMMGRKFYDNNYLNGSTREEVAASIERHNGHIATLIGVKELTKDYQTFQKLFETCAGKLYFVASITETRNDANPDDPYTNLNTRIKVISHAELAQSNMIPPQAVEDAKKLKANGGTE